MTQPQPEQLPLPGMTGTELRDLGVSRLAGSDTEWQVEADRALAYLIGSGEPFTAADLTDLAGLPNKPNKVGGYFIGAAKARRIVPTGSYVQARRPASHARTMREWVGA